MGERHRAALAAVGAEQFHDALETPVGQRFAQEVAGLADHLYHLAMDATRENATMSISSTLQSRRLWLDAMGVTDKSRLATWLDRPITTKDRSRSPQGCWRTSGGSRSVRRPWLGS